MFLNKYSSYNVFLFSASNSILNSLKTGYIPEKVPPETRYPSYNTLKFPFHHLFYTCHCMAPKAPQGLATPHWFSFYHH